jgi:hypothetical protein
VDADLFGKHDWFTNGSQTLVKFNLVINDLMGDILDFVVVPLTPC